MAKNHPFLHCITIDQLHEINRAQRNVYTLKGTNDAIVNTEEFFWKAIVDHFPLNPPLHVKQMGKPMGALADSLFGGLLGTHETHVDIVWPYADSISQSFLLDKVGFWRDVAFSISPDDAQRIQSGEGGVVLRLFLLCANAQNRDRLQNLLYPLFQYIE